MPIIPAQDVFDVLEEKETTTSELAYVPEREHCSFLFTLCLCVCSSLPLSPLISVFSPLSYPFWNATPKTPAMDGTMFKPQEEQSEERIKSNIWEMDFASDMEPGNSRWQCQDKGWKVLHGILQRKQNETKRKTRNQVW